MADISKFSIDGTEYDLKDATARTDTTANANAIAAINGKIPSDASSTNKMATAADITGIATNTTAIQTINEKIPSNASSTNKMATAADITGIATNTTAIQTINEKIPSNASSANKMVTVSDLNQKSRVGYTDITFDIRSSGAWNQSILFLSQKIPANATIINIFTTFYNTSQPVNLTLSYSATDNCLYTLGAQSTGNIARVVYLY